MNECLYGFVSDHHQKCAKIKMYFLSMQLNYENKQTNAKYSIGYLVNELYFRI